MWQPTASIRPTNPDCGVQPVLKHALLTGRNQNDVASPEILS